MKKIAVFLMAVLLPALAQASDVKPEVALDTIGFQLSAKQWVSTEKALLTVNVNATLSSGDLVKLRNEIMAKLAEIAKGDWHITQFDRSQDSSGLEKLQVQAQVRVSQADLAAIYQQAKAISKPGATYTVDSIDFKPGLEEKQQTAAQLRELLYKQVTAELERINKVYSPQSYSLSRLIFVDGDAPVVQPRAYQARDMNLMATAAAAPALEVSNELTLTAVVLVASNRVKAED